jgi:type IV pilus assembly protein PilM
MLKSKSFLAVDFGAGSLKLAEFEINEAGGLRLKQYAIKSLGLEGSQEATREATILKALQELISERGIKSRELNVCAPGFHVFSKFVKLPPVDAGKVTQIIQYEAQQNVPFPLAEVVWDYQIMGSAPSGELEVLLVAIKAEVVEGLFRVADAAKLKLQVADVSPAALCNAFRYNYGDLEDCTMLLDIGAKTSNLLFFEKGKVFSRSINLGAHAITQDFATEAKLKFDAAEKLKIEEGFVSLGGAYEEPENPNQAAISKIARQFMTRLHIQVNQTMQFYRGQQGGSAPQRLFLSGGASIMPYTAQFFAEKLNVPVEYFNPFRNVQIDPAVNLEDMARVAHSLGEVVGLGLRNLAHCPVELNLMPESTRKWRTFNEKKPYLIGTVFSLALVVAVIGLLFQKLADVKQAELDQNVKAPLEKARAQKARFDKAYSQLTKTRQELEQLTTWMGDRYYWGDVLTEMRRVLIRTEEASQQKLKIETGIWIEQFLTSALRPETSPDGSLRGMGMPAEDAIRLKYGLGGGPAQANPNGMPVSPNRMPVVGPGMSQESVYNSNPSSIPLTPDASSTSATNEISKITIVCRALLVDKEITYTLQNELKNSPLFDPAQTQLSTQSIPDEQTGTFSFAVSVALKQPLKF